jgi:DcuC family C4-dicarboxylate transporter
MVNLLITVAFVVVAVLLISRGVNTTALFMFLGVIIGLGYTLFTGRSVAAVSSGSHLLDILEVFKETFVGSFSSIGLAMLPIYAYSAYMNKIGAASVLGGIIARPIAKSKNPYFVGIFITIVVCAIMRIAIVSAIAVMALFMSTLFPALCKSGISRTSAISAIFLGTCFDWGPADFATAQIFIPVPEFTPTAYFLGASLKVLPILLLIMALISGFIMQAIDKKSGYVFGSDAPAEDPGVEGQKLPGFYALLPLLPLFIILGFSPLFVQNINMSVLTAVLLCIFIVFMVELVRKKNLKERIADAIKWVDGLGEGFGALFFPVVTISFYATMLGKLEGFSFMVDTALNAGISGMLLLIVLGILTISSCLLLGQGVFVAILLTPQLTAIASSMGISFYAAALPVNVANGLRCFNFGTGPHSQYTSKVAKTSSIAIFKCLARPSIIM